AGGDERYRRDAQEYGWHARKATVRRRRSQTLAPPTVPGSFAGEPEATPASRHGLDGMGHMSCTPGRRAALSGRTSALPDHVRTHMSISFGWYQEGGPTMLLIALVAAAGLVVLAERVYVIVLRSKNNGRPFIERTIQLVRAGKVDDAIKECAGSKAALPDIGLLILRSRSGEEPALQNVADAAVLTVLPKLTRRLQYLSALAAAAVMLGAIGLFAGIHDSLINPPIFPSLGIATANHASALAAACVPPIFGLAVAIVLLLGRAYLVSQAEAITEQIREYAARLINALLDRPDVRLGHR